MDQRLHSSVALSTLNRRVLRLGQAEGSFVSWNKGEAPPVVRVDGIWITVMFASGETCKDKMGRNRPVKQGRKVPILAAQGVWPTTGHTQLIAWMRADGEDAASWQKFLEALYEAGLTPNATCFEQFNFSSEEFLEYGALRPAQQTGRTAREN